MLAAARRTLAAGGAGVLATVARVAGSAYRRPGARMWFPPDGDPVGMVSGGCLEADLAERAADVAATGRATRVVYDMRSPDDIVWGLGLGCNGEIRVLLERLGPGAAPEWLDRLSAWDAARRPGALALCYESGRDDLPVGTRRGLAAPAIADPAGRDEPAFGPPAAAPLDGALRDALGSGRSADVEAAGARWLVEATRPPVRLLVLGAGMDAVPVVELAARLGWDVRLFDRREAALRPDRFPGAATLRAIDPDRWAPEPGLVDARTAALVMTHHFLDDVALLRALLAAAPPYVGVLGPAKRRDNLLAELGLAGPPPPLHGPVGLDLGAETPEEIALSAIAEIQAVLAGREARSLRERDAPLHP